METVTRLELLAAMLLNRITIPNTSTKMEITPLWLMSLVKLESMCPSFKEFTYFMHQFLPYFLSLSRMAMFISLKQREYERNLKSCSKRGLLHLASDSDDSKISKFCATMVKPEDAKSNSEILKSYFVFFDERIHCPSDIKNYFYEEFTYSFFGSREESDMLGYEFSVDDVLSLAQNFVSAIASSLGIPIRDINMGYDSEEHNDSNTPFKEEGNKPEGEIIVSVESGHCELSRRVSSKRLSSNLELEKDDLSYALCRPLKENSEIENSYLLTSIFDYESSDDASSKCKSSNSGVSDVDNFSEKDFALREEIEPRGSAITACNFCSSGRMSSKNISSNSDMHEDNYSEEAEYPLKEETETQGSKITESDFCSRRDKSRECNSSRSDVQYSEEADSPLKEGTDSKRSTLTGDFYSSIEIPNKCILSNFGRQFVISGESFKIINLIEFAYHLRENDYSKESMSISFENSEEVEFYFFDQADFENAKLLQNQFLCAKKYAEMKNLVQEEDFPERKGSNIKKDSENDCQTSIFGEAKNLLESEFLEYLQEIVEEIPPAEEGTCSQLQEESEFQEDIEEIHFKEQNQEDDSNVKIDYSVKKTNKYGCLDNDLVQKILFSVYDFICEIEGNAAFSMEKQNLISELQVESEDIHSEPGCVKSIQILLYLLNNITMDLESKKDEASKLKLGLEDVRELYSCDIKNTKEGRELQETAKKLVADYEKVYVGIEKDLAHCEWYYKNLENILDFYQNKCFISSPGL